MAITPDIVRCVTIDRQPPDLDRRADASGCLYLFDGQRTPGPLRWQTGGLHGQGQPLLTQTALLMLQAGAHDESGPGRGSQIERRRLEDSLIGGPGAIKVSLIAGLQIQIPYPLFERRRPQGNLCCRPIHLGRGPAIDAFVGVVVAVAVVGEFIDMIHDANGRTDIGRREQAKQTFGKTPVTDTLVVLQQRLHQGLRICHLALLDTVLRRVPAIAIIQGDQQRCVRIDVLPPFFLDQLCTELLGRLRQSRAHHRLECFAQRQMFGVKRCPMVIHVRSMATVFGTPT
ncbi:hypothetical protein D3C78_524890 [compost metagenome]